MRSFTSDSTFDMDHNLVKKILSLAKVDQHARRRSYSKALRHAYMLGMSYHVDKDDRPLRCLRPSDECSECGQLLGMCARVLCTYVTVLDPTSMQSACEAGEYAHEDSIFSLCLACGGSMRGGWYTVSIRPCCRFKTQDRYLLLLVDVVEVQTAIGSIISRQECRPGGQHGPIMFQQSILPDGRIDLQA